MQQCFLDLDLATNVLKDKAEVNVSLFAFENAVLCKVPIFKSLTALSADRPSDGGSFGLHSDEGIISCFNLFLLDHVPFVDSAPGRQSVRLAF